MLLTDAALHKISGSGASPGGVHLSPACSWDAELPELSDTSEDERKKAQAASSFRAPLPADYPNMSASRGPSAGPSTPNGGWVESRDLERQQWVDEAAAFQEPGTWGDIMEVGSPKPSGLGRGQESLTRLPPSPSSFQLAGIPMPKDLADLGRSDASSAAPRSSPAPEVGADKGNGCAHNSAPADVGNMSTSHAALRVLTASSSSEAAVRALLLSGRPKHPVLEAKPQLVGLLQRGLPIVASTARRGESVSLVLPVPDSSLAYSAEIDDIPASHYPEVSGQQRVGLDSDGDQNLASPESLGYDPLDRDVLSDGDAGNDSFSNSSSSEEDSDGAFDEGARREKENLLEDWRRRIGGGGGEASVGHGEIDELPSDSDDEGSLPASYCCNCTARLFTGTRCQDCGHDVADDSSLFAVHPAAAAAASAAVSAAVDGGADCTVLAWDERMALHGEGRAAPHPERPDRLRAVMANLLNSGIAARCKLLPGRQATVAELEACHSPALLDLVESSSAEAHGTRYFTPDTYANQHTATCASLAAAACADVATAVFSGRARAGAAIVRPPGHHAESGLVMGFCFYNNAGIAARAAQAAGARRVLILDWDVHHGNGTQHIFEEDDSVLYMSLHRHDNGSFFPGTGAVAEVGHLQGRGFSVNVPWPHAGIANGDYLAVFNHVLVPIAYEFAPDLIIVSAGFDAAEGDPIGGCAVSPACFGHLTALLQPVAPLALILEGGYNLEVTARSVAACMRVLLGERPSPLPSDSAVPSASGLATIREVTAVQAKYWKCLRGLSAQWVPPQNAFPGLRFQEDAFTSSHGPGAYDAVSEGEYPSYRAVPTTNGCGSREAQGDGDCELPHCGNGGPHSLERSLRRSKLPRRQCGKSSRRWHMLQSLHLAVVKLFLKKQRRRQLLRRMSAGSSEALSGGTSAAAANLEETCLP